MKRYKRTISVLMVFTMLLSLVSCTSDRRKGAERIQSPDASKKEYQETEPFAPTDETALTDTPAPTNAAPGQIVEFTMFSGAYGNEINKDNKIQK